MARFFQHLNVQDSFQMVTELDYIDDTDPSFVLYHFKDGSKCNQQFIGQLNEKDVYGRYEFVEVSSPQNAWKFHIQELLTGQDEKPQFITNDQGTFEIPPETDFVGAKGAPRQIVNVLQEPYFVTPTKEVEVPIHKMETTGLTVTGSILYPSTQDTIEQKANENTITEQQPKAISTTQPIENPVIVQQPESIHTIASKFFQNLQTLYNEDNRFQFSFSLEGQRYQLGIKDLFDKMLKPVEPQLIEKEIVKEVIKPSEENIPININDTQKLLIDNMIDMAVKDTCDIDMSLTLKLPSITVYDVLKKNYPNELSEGFVNIIANRMKIRDLKRAVAAGLLSYYNGDIENEETPAQIEAPIIDASLNDIQITKKKQKRKAGRPKKTDK